MCNNLDLHGVKHVDAPREVDKFLGQHLMGGSKSVIIITGKSPTMKQIVRETLTDYNMNYVENPFNNGEVVINLI